MKYPKLSAAIDDTLAKLVKDHGEDAITMLLEMATTVGKIDGAPDAVLPLHEKLPPIPVTKEVVDAD